MDYTTLLDADQVSFEELDSGRKGSKQERPKKRRDRSRKGRKPSRPVGYIGLRSNKRLRFR
jgi:hypothetical protein